MTTAAALAALLVLAGCSGGTGADAAPPASAPVATTPPAASASPADPAKEPEAGAPIDLVGDWKQTNSEADDAWQAATITDSGIEVYWVTDNGDTRSLYWAGTFAVPQDAGDSFTVTSENDHEKTDAAMLASSDDTKVFSFRDGELSYEVSALGTTTTVRIARQ